MTDHYLECVDLDCPGCLPTDEQVTAMVGGEANRECLRRHVTPVPGVSGRRDAVLADADEYRARSAAARAARFGG